MRSPQHWFAESESGSLKWHPFGARQRDGAHLKCPHSQTHSLQSKVMLPPSGICLPSSVTQSPVIFYTYILTT